MMEGQGLAYSANKVTIGAAPKPAETAVEMDRLFKSIELLQNKTGMLDARLAPVLHPVTPEATDNGTEKQTSTISEHGQKIRKALDVVKALDNSVIQRLEI